MAFRQATKTPKVSLQFEPPVKENTPPKKTPLKKDTPPKKDELKFLKDRLELAEKAIIFLSDALDTISPKKDEPTESTDKLHTNTISDLEANMAKFKEALNVIRKDDVTRGNQLRYNMKNSFELVAKAFYQCKNIIEEQRAHVKAAMIEKLKLMAEEIEKQRNILKHADDADPINQTERVNTVSKSGTRPWNIPHKKIKTIEKSKPRLKF